MIRVAIIGLGRIGLEFGLESGRIQPASHYHCYKQLGAEIAFCDSDKNKLELACSIDLGGLLPFEDITTLGPYYTDCNELLTKFQPEIVSICTPSNTHKDITIAVANYPSVKTIFLEKPIAQSLQEADAILSACKEHDIRLAVNYSRRWSQVYRTSRATQSRPVHIIGVHPGPLLRTGTHMLNLFQLFADGGCSLAPTVQAFGPHVLADYMQGTDDFNVNGIINYGKSTATLIGNLPAVPQDTVLFEFDAITKDDRIRITENGSRSEYYERRASKRYNNLDEYRRTLLSEHEQENCLLTAIQELLNPKIPPACTGMDARNTLQIALALHYSATHGNKQVTLNEVPYDYTVRSY